MRKQGATHESLKRLLAAMERKNHIGPASVARSIDETEQTLTNWSTRGVSKKGALKVQAIHGISAQWIQDGTGPELLAHAVNMPLLVDPTIPVRKVKLIKLEAAGMYLETLNNEKVKPSIFCGLDAGPKTFAVTITNTSADPDLPLGSVAIVDPDEQPRDGDWVIADQDGVVVIKRIQQDGADLYLTGIKPRALDSVTLIGVVIGLNRSFR